MQPSDEYAKRHIQKPLSQSSRCNEKQNVVDKCELQAQSTGWDYFYSYDDVSSCRNYVEGRLCWDENPDQNFLFIGDVIEITWSDYMANIHVTRDYIISKIGRGAFIESFPIHVKETDSEYRGDLTIIPPDSRDEKGGVVATQQGIANVRDTSVRFDDQTHVPRKGEERNELLVIYVLVPRTRREFYGELRTDQSQD